MHGVNIKEIVKRNLRNAEYTALITENETVLQKLATVALRKRNSMAMNIAKTKAMAVSEKESA